MNPLENYLALLHKGTNDAPILCLFTHQINGSFFRSRVGLDVQMK